MPEQRTGADDPTGTAGPSVEDGRTRPGDEPHADRPGDDQPGAEQNAHRPAGDEDARPGERRPGEEPVAGEPGDEWRSRSADEEAESPGDADQPPPGDDTDQPAGPDPSDRDHRIELPDGTEYEGRYGDDSEPDAPPHHDQLDRILERHGVPGDTPQERRQRFDEDRRRHPDTYDQATRDRMAAIRNEATVQQGDIVQKVLNPGTAESMLNNGNYHDSVRGFGARHDDVRELNTPERNYDGYALTFDGTTFGPDQHHNFALRFPADDPEHFVPAYSDDMQGSPGLDDSRTTGPEELEYGPFMGSGYTDSDGIYDPQHRDSSMDGYAVPEVKIGDPNAPGGAIPIPEGAEIWQQNADGSERMVARFDGSDWQVDRDFDASRAGDYGADPWRDGGSGPGADPSPGPTAGPGDDLRSRSGDDDTPTREEPTGEDEPNADDRGDEPSDGDRGEDEPSTEDRGDEPSDEDRGEDGGDEPNGEDEPRDEDSRDERGDVEESGDEGDGADRDDVGWQGEGRSLTEAENAYADGILADAQANEPGITRDLRDTAASVPGGRLVGEEYSRKSEDSFKRKFADEIAQSPDSTLPEIAHGMKDTVRYTVEMPAESYGQGAQRVFDHLAEQGYEPWVEPKNTWGGEKYKGINSFWHDPRTGQVFEVQVHTPESFAAKMDTHEIYERQRTTEDPAEAARLQEQQNEIFRQVPVPAGATDVGLPPGVEPVGDRHAPSPGTEVRPNDGAPHRTAEPTATDRPPGDRSGTEPPPGDRSAEPTRDLDQQDDAGHDEDGRHDEEGRHDEDGVDDGPDELPQYVSDDEAHAAMAEHVRETPAGYEFTGDPEMRPYTDAVRPEDGYVNLDSHATRHGYLKVGDQLLTPEQYARGIQRLADEGRIDLGDNKIKLSACDTGHGEHPPAQRIAQALGREVKAPTEKLWTDRHGNEVVASSEENNGHRPTIPPDGHWRSFDADGHETGSHLAGDGEPSQLVADDAVPRSVDVTRIRDEDLPPPPKGSHYEADEVRVIDGTKDRYDRIMGVGSDREYHAIGDPRDTHRDDEKGVLVDTHNRFVKEPDRPGIVYHENEKSTDDHAVTTRKGSEEIRQAVEDRDAIVDDISDNHAPELARAADEVNETLRRLGLDELTRKELTNSKVGERLKALRDACDERGEDVPLSANKLETAVARYWQRRDDLVGASERLGTAGALEFARNEFGVGDESRVHQLTGDDKGRGTPGNLDMVLFAEAHGEPPQRTLAVVEAKGAGSTLGSALVPGPDGPKVRAMQCSPEYVRELLGADNKLGPALERLRETDRPAYDRLVDAIRDGSLRVESYKVQVSAVGTLKVTEYELGRKGSGNDLIPFQTKGMKVSGIPAEASASG